MGVGVRARSSVRIRVCVWVCARARACALAVYWNLWQFHGDFLSTSLESVIETSVLVTLPETPELLKEPV